METDWNPFFLVLRKQETKKKENPLFLWKKKTITTSVSNEDEIRDPSFLYYFFYPFFSCFPFYYFFNNREKGRNKEFKSKILKKPSRLIFFLFRVLNLR